MYEARDALKLLQANLMVTVSTRHYYQPACYQAIGREDLRS